MTNINWKFGWVICILTRPMLTKKWEPRQNCCFEKIRVKGWWHQRKSKLSRSIGFSLFFLFFLIFRLSFTSELLSPQFWFVLFLVSCKIKLLLVPHFTTFSDVFARHSTTLLININCRNCSKIEVCNSIKHSKFKCFSPNIMSFWVSFPDHAIKWLILILSLAMPASSKKFIRTLLGKNWFHFFNDEPLSKFLFLEHLECS